MISRASALGCALALAVMPAAASGQSTLDLSGDATVLASVMPRRDVAELRPELSLDVTWRPGQRVRLHLETRATALVANRTGRTADLAAEVRDGWIEFSGARGDLRVGYGRIIWGRLDEVQPTDVVNPIDAARFLLDGRSQARRAVGFVRGRMFASDAFAIEGVVVPGFRRGTYDALDEETSPFNVTRDVVFPASVSGQGRPVEHVRRALSLENVSGGVRMTATVGRLDLAVAGFRGFEAFGPLTLEVAPPARPGELPQGRLVDHHSRFTMIGGDFETVIGNWAWRGEAAVFVEKTLAGVTVPGLVDGHVFEAGTGFDRPVAGSRVYGSVLVRREWSPDDATVARTDVDLVGSVERRFARERYLARGFAVVNPKDASAFVRGVFAWNVRDNVVFEGSAGVFLGTGDDALSRFKTRDFVFARFGYHF